MSILLAISDWNPEPWRERLGQFLPGHAVRIWPDLGDPAEIRYAVCWKPPHGVLKQLPNLRAILSLGAGVDHVMADPDLPRAVPLVRVIDPELTQRMTEWVVLHVLFHHRRMPAYLARQRAREWRDERDQPAARQVRVGIMGLGVLGRDAARALAALGYDLAGWSRSRKQVEGLRTFAGEAELGAFLGRTDILVCLLPLTPETRGMLNAQLIEALARDGRLDGPVLLNAGRGGLQVEDDILAALDDGRLAGASLDVFQTEPLPQASGFWAHPKVVVTPHNAAASEPDFVGRYIARQIERCEAGLEPENLVDTARGY